MEMYIEDLISGDLHIPVGRIVSIAEDPAPFYYPFVLGDRIIEAPETELKLMQSWIHDFIGAETEKLPIFITAYEPQTSIRVNAMMHRENSHILCLDIKSFFAHCADKEIEAVFRSIRMKEPLPNGSHKLPDEDVDMLVSLSTLRGALSVGSPCSPLLANRIMHPVDLEIIASLGPGFTYTRYSDDICISSNDWIDQAEIVELVASVLHFHGFQLNEGKTRCFGRGNARRITGVYLTPDGDITVGSGRKREVNRLLYRFLVLGEGSPEVLLGLLNFCSSIEPGYVSRLLAKYANYGIAAECDGVIDAIKRSI